MMKKYMRCILMILIFALLCSSMMGGVLAENSSRMLHLSSYTPLIAKTGTTTITIEFIVEAHNIMDKLGAKYITIQRSTDNVNWTNVITRDSTSYPQYIAANTSTHSHSFTYYGTKGYYYRVKIMFYASLNTGSETRTGYSSSVKL